MKIIHVAQFLGIGGLEKIIFHLAIGQKKLGHDVSVYIYDELRTWVDFFKSNGINVITPPIKKAGYDFKLLRRMNKDLMDADVVHSHDLNPLMYLGPLIKFRKIFKLSTPRLIHSAHGLDHIENYSRALTYQKLVSPLADKVIGVSDKIGQFYLNKINLSPKKVRVIQNGIATFDQEISNELRNEKKSWLISRHGLDMNKPIILSLSRIVPLKDQNFLIDAIGKLPEYQLLVVGPSGDDEYYNELKKLNYPNVFFVAPQEAVLDYNLGSDIYVSASTHEGIPVAVLEAMAVQTPCLVSNIPGHQTLLKNGDAINIYELGNSNDFTNKLKLILNNEPNMQQLQLAKGLVESEYSLEKNGEDIPTSLLIYETFK